MCEESTAKSFLNLIKDIIIQIQEVQYTQSKLNERKTPRHNLLTLLKTTDKLLKAFRVKKR